MEKHIVDEKTGIGYTLQGDYYIPDLTLPPETDNRPIGVWGRRHRDFLKNHRKAIYSIMLMDNTLHSYLADLNEQANDMFFRLVKDMAKAEGITENLKAENQMLWIQEMNNIRNRAKYTVDYHDVRIYIDPDQYTAPAGNSGSADITLNVAKELSYEMVIPSDVTLDAAGIFEVGQAKVTNVKNATDSTVISYTAATTAFKSEGKSDVPAAYYTDAQGTNAFPTTAVEVYKNKADAASIPTMYVGISETDWNAAENGTYTATVTYNFIAD